MWLGSEAQISKRHHWHLWMESGASICQQIDILCHGMDFMSLNDITSIIKIYAKQQINSNKIMWHNLWLRRKCNIWSFTNLFLEGTILILDDQQLWFFNIKRFPLVGLKLVQNYSSFRRKIDSFPRVGMFSEFFQMEDDNCVHFHCISLSK